MVSAFILTFNLLSIYKFWVLPIGQSKNIFWYFRMRKLLEILIWNRTVVNSLLLINFERLYLDLKIKFHWILAREREAPESSFFASNVLFDLYLQRVTLRNLKSNRHGKALKQLKNGSKTLIGEKGIRQRFQK